jgi:hypothetical protein
MGIQSDESPNFGNYVTPRKKSHLGVATMASHKEYYKGEGGGFPQVRAMMNIVSLCMLVVCLCIKKFQLCINQLVVWFVHIDMNS